MPEKAFYLSLGDDRYQPTGHTAGPWAPDAQHFGPPSSLLVRALEALPAELSAGARVVARASAWRMSASDTSGVATLPVSDWPKPDDCEQARWPEEWLHGYLTAVDWRAVPARPRRPGRTGRAGTAGPPTLTHGAAEIPRPGGPIH